MLIKKYKVCYQDSIGEDGEGQTIREEYVDSVDDLIKLLLDISDNPDVEVNTEFAYDYENKVQLVDVILPQYEFYLHQNGELIRSGHYARGYIIDEVSDDAYQVRMLLPGNPVVIVYYDDLILINP